MYCKDSGPANAEIMLVGEAPGAEEEKAGVPFVGQAGKLLKHLLEHSGINYNDCYVTNIMPTRPPNNKFSCFYEKKNKPTKELEEGWQKLREKVLTIRPKVVVTLGAEPLKALCNKDKISHYRGTWLSVDGVNVLPTYHPAYVLRQYSSHVIVELDLQKALNNTPAPVPPLIIQPSVQQVVSWIDKHINTKRVSFDIEIVGRQTRCIGFAGRDEIDSLSAICIPLIRFSSSTMAKPSRKKALVKLSTTSGEPNRYWSKGDEKIVLSEIDRVFKSGIEVVGHNSVSFDEPILNKEFGFVIKNHYLDTMNCWHNLYPELPNGLDFLCSVYTDLPNYWTEKNTSSDKSEWEYNALDCVVTLIASEKVEEESKERESF